MSEASWAQLCVSFASIASTRLAKVASTFASLQYFSQLDGLLSGTHQLVQGFQWRHSLIYLFLVATLFRTRNLHFYV